MSYHGVTCKIVRQKLDAKISREFLGILSGGAANQTFYTKNIPITDAAGADTDDETDVDVYTDDGVPGTWTEYLDDGSDFTIDGGTGAVVIQAAENQGGNAGERVSISYYTKAEVGSGQGVSIESLRDLIERHKLGGSGTVEEVKAGKHHVTLNFESFYINRNELGSILSVGDFNEKLTAYDFYMYPNLEVTGQPRILVSDIQAEMQRIEVDVDSLILVGATFKGIAVTIDTVPA